MTYFYRAGGGDRGHLVPLPGPATAKPSLTLFYWQRVMIFFFFEKRRKLVNIFQCFQSETGSHPIRSDCEVESDEVSVVEDVLHTGATGLSHTA